MNIPVIGFIPPHVGLDGDFNTFRLGLTLLKRLEPGRKVLLMCEKTKAVFGIAEVMSLSSGSLVDMCQAHGARNHTELGALDPEASPMRLLTFVRKIYGPHIATDAKKTTVVYLRRFNEFRADDNNAFWEVQGVHH